MNDADIAGIVEELEGLVGVPFNSLWQPARDRVVLGFANGTQVLMVPRGPFARLHTVTERPKNPARPFSFQGACRARVRGALSAVHKVKDDRIVRLTFGTSVLELRLTGRSGGLWLIHEGIVVAAYDGPAIVLPLVPTRVPRPDPASFTPLTGESFNEAANRIYAALEAQSGQSALQTRVAQALHRAVARNRRLVDHLEEDLGRAAKAESHRAQADLLAANLHRAERGASEVYAVDWATGETVVIPINPSRPASYTLDKLYRQAKRLERVTVAVTERLVQVRRDQAGYLAALAQITAAEFGEPLSEGWLTDLERRLPRSPARRAAEAGDPDLPYTIWVGPGGARVLIGRNARGNRKLTFQVAKGNDWWMHIRERPGAHIVLPVTKGKTPTLEHLLAAAQIALHAAHAAPTEAAEVQYTRVKDVRAVPGEGARVTLSNEKVLRVVRDASQLAGWAPEVTTESA